MKEIKILKSHYNELLRVYRTNVNVGNGINVKLSAVFTNSKGTEMRTDIAYDYENDTYYKLVIID